MRFTVTMKDPDTLYDAITDAVRASVAEIAGLDADEREVVEEERLATVRSIAGKWFEYGEYLTVEIDTDAKTATVMPVTP